MEQQRELPTLEIIGDRFYVDAYRGHLTLAEDAKKAINFKDMDFDSEIGPYYRFLYDQEKKEIFKLNSGLEKLPANVLYVEIPDRYELDPVGVSMRTDPSGQASERLKALALHSKARIIPTVHLVGDDFYVDIRSLSFIDTLDHKNRINFADVNITEDGTIFFDYNSLTRNVQKDNEPYESYEHISLVMLKSYDQLDPEGWKLKEALSPKPIVLLEGKTNPETEQYKRSKKSRNLSPPDKSSKKRKR